MAQPILMPKLGQTVEECLIVRWLKSEGDTVAKGDVLFEIETDKATLEAESFHDGVLLKIFYSEGEVVPVQTTVAFVGEAGEEAPPAPPPPKPVEPPKEAPAPVAPTAAMKSASIAQPATPAPVQAESKRAAISPRARRLAKLSVIDPSPVQGTGPGGRVVEKDVEAYLESQGYGQLRVTPAAKNLASMEELDILRIEGSGEGGKILVADVELAVAEKPKAMSKMRQIIAARLTQSFTSTPHFFVTVSVDVTDLLDLRRKLKAEQKAYSMTDFVMESVVLALKKYPDVNSTTDGRSVSWHSKVNLGLAVALESGLVVPVIRNAEDLTLQELHDAAATLVKKARDGKLGPDEMQGSTFTISNMGMLNVENFTAIINPGESAILAVSSAIETPVVRKGKVAVRSIMKMTISSDHRIVDGALAAHFINKIKTNLEDMDLWKRLT